MTDNVAVLLGNGPYGRHLHTELYKKSSMADYAVSLIPEDASIFDETEIDHWFSLGTSGKLFRFLAERDVNKVVLGGDFRLSYRLFVDHVASSLKFMTFFARYRTIGGMLEGAREALDQRGITPVNAGVYLPDLHVPAEELAHPMDPSVRKLLPEIVRRARIELSRQPIFTVRQCLVFDNLSMIAPETSGTDALLSKVSAVQKPHGTHRVMVKLCPPNFDHRFDPPVIGLKTIEGAESAKIDVIVVEANRGIIMHRQEVIDRCVDAGITLIGVPQHQAQGGAKSLAV